MHAWIKDRQKFTAMACTFVIYVITISLALTYRRSSFAPWFIIPLSLLHLYFYGVIHELSHNNIFTGHTANIWIGHLLCPLNLVYFHAFKTIHLQRHRFAQIPVIDPVCTLKPNGEPFNPFVYLLVWPYYAVRWYVRHLSQHRNRRRLLTNYLAFSAGVYALFGVGLMFGVFSTMVLYWALPVYIGTVFLIGIRNLIEHYGCESTRYRTSRTVTNGVLNTLTFNSFFHLEHHLWPTATIAQLRELHERNREIYREKGAFIV
jgi:fatty acid desaturase